MVRIRFGSSKVVVSGHGLVTASLTLTVHETLKWLSWLPIHSGGDRVAIDRYIIISISTHLHTPFSLSLISLVVSVDVKYHGNSLTVFAKPTCSVS